MAAWILYVLLVSLLLGLAALAFEYSALIRKKGTRWLWSVGILASLALPFVISSITVQLPSLTRPLPAPDPGRAIVLRQMTESALSPARWIAVSGQEKFVWSPTTTMILAGSWAMASVLLLGGLLLSGARLNRRRRNWSEARIAGQPVLVSETVGPAVIGLFDTEIVVPRWLLDAPPGVQELVVAHEQSHLEANDAQLLLMALCLVVCMPWNLPLWWQLRRLRRAIEIDCDARVLRRGHDAGRYGETLLMVGERHAGGIAAVAAMTESKSFLEQRISTMLRKKAKFAWASALAVALVGLMLAAGAAEVAPPNGDKPERHEVSVDPKTLDLYVGHYRLAESAIMTVTRDGSRLTIQLTGQSPLPIYAESPNRFFAKAVDAQLTFMTGADGMATALTLHQNGRDMTMSRLDDETARRVASERAARFASQTPRPGSEAVLRALVEGIIAGNPPYDRMGPELAQAVRQQQPVMSRMLAGKGAVTAIRFSGVDPNGGDVFAVLQERGASRWQILLDDKGLATGAWMTPSS